MMLNLSSTIISVHHLLLFALYHNPSLEDFTLISTVSIKMYRNIQSVAISAAIALAPVVSAHGYVSGIVSNGEWYSGTSPEWFYASTKPDTAGWYAENQDNGFVAPAAFADPDIICHRGATVGTGVIPVTAGETVDLQWVRCDLPGA